MSSKPITLSIRPRGKPIQKLPETLTFESFNSAADIYKRVAEATQYSIHRLRITKGSDGSVVSNVHDINVPATGLRDQSVVYVKDLGPQVSWTTVFILEYLGPIVIHILAYLLRPHVYPDAPAEPSEAQTLVMLLTVGHFIKRELETLFVHRFSAATMPIRNVPKNCGHYWGLSGALMAAFIYAPGSSAAKQDNALQINIGLVMFVVGELGNFYTHMVLRGLRTAGTTERNIPRGVLFDIVTCPNYMMEIISWSGVFLISGFNWTVAVFMVVAMVQMALWAKKKERRYRKEFPDKYKKKTFSMFPGIY